MYNCNLKKNYIGFNSKGKAIIMKKLGRKGSACMMAIALCAMTVPVFAGSIISLLKVQSIMHMQQNMLDL